MRIEHIAIWTDDIEAMRAFYTRYFGMTSNELYINPAKGYSSYFLSFGGGNEGGTRIELMNRPDIAPVEGKRGLHKGLAHFTVELGSREAVDRLTERLRADGYTIEGEPRSSGDGYYESVVLDPEGNYIELLA